jgi:hypothetical protein
MSDEPSYPENASVGNEAPKDTASEGSGEDKRKRKRVATGVAVGIGSAAIVAALLYANRNRGNDKGG